MNLNQVTIPSTDLNKSIQFYETLGLKLIVNSLPNYIRFLCPDGNSTFSVHLVKELSEGEAPVIYFECDDLDDQVEKLKSEGVAFDQDPINQTWLWREARLTDPDGNKLILFNGGENRINPPWRVSED